MESTKERIMAAALRQFNELGTDAVTVRSIAEEVGISHGNLCYHFKNTDVLVEALYLQMVDEMAVYVEASRDPVASLEELFGQYDASLRLMYRYRFLLLDFVRINRRITSIRDHFRQLMQLRRVQFRATVQNLLDAGLIRRLPDNTYYEHMIQHAILISDAWIPRAEILYDEVDEPVIRHYLDLAGSILVPYLTEKGWEEYGKLNRKTE